MPKDPKIVCIHGATASSTSFNYIVDRLKLTNVKRIDYNSNTPFFKNLDNMIEEIGIDDPVFIIAHSLGGLYAVHLTQHINIVGAVTISTPYNGSVMAEFAARMAPTYQLFRDIGIFNPPVLRARDIKIDVPWTQIVTTSGKNPWLLADNDGVVSYSSMTARADINYEYLDHNHYEIMLSPKTTDIIKKKLITPL